MAVGSLAIIGTVIPLSRHQIAYLTPQQFFLLLSAVSAVRCVSQGAFADGVQRPPLFILADQIPSLLVLVFYSWATYFAYRQVAISQSAKEAIHDVVPGNPTR